MSRHEWFEMSTSSGPTGSSGPSTQETCLLPSAEEQSCYRSDASQSATAFSACDGDGTIADVTPSCGCTNDEESDNLRPPPPILNPSDEEEKKRNFNQWIEERIDEFIELVRNRRAYNFLKLVKQIAIVALITLAVMAAIYGGIYFLHDGPRGMCLFPTSYGVPLIMDKARVSAVPMNGTVVLVYGTERALLLREFETNLTLSSIDIDNGVNGTELDVVTLDLFCSRAAKKCYHFSEGFTNEPLLLSTADIIALPNGKRLDGFVTSSEGSRALLVFYSGGYSIGSLDKDGKSFIESDVVPIHKEAVVKAVAQTWGNEFLFVYYFDGHYFIQMPFSKRDHEKKELKIDASPVAKISMEETPEAWKILVQEPMETGQKPSLYQVTLSTTDAEKSLDRLNGNRAFMHFQPNYTNCLTRFRVCEIKSSQRITCLERVDPRDNTGCNHTGEQCIDPKQYDSSKEV